MAMYVFIEVNHGKCLTSFIVTGGVSFYRSVRKSCLGQNILLISEK